ncbi:hypothetical protein TARUN_1925 [Trichoderma arundinaceum]|uniref:Uncharacterized protein n=1 Tax=Trichoderma arundinaceum TaxID=490622 RepID=A0A395NVX0_TRIAR|nr:hypothetical protein TARUN_1925 [Trichoderma arundinaceum]
MSVNSTERTTRLHNLDLQYQQSRHKTDLISRDEDARRLQLRVLLLRDENTQLLDKCAAKDTEMKTLSRNTDLLRVELDTIKIQNRSENAQIKSPAIGATGLAVEVEACESPMQDLKKALEENIALTKELQQLRPEIELLRSQVTNYEKMISEQGLQQQQEQSRNELESKKQSKSKKSNDESENIVELRSKLDRTIEKLAEGQRQQEKMQLDHQKELDESQRQKHKLEERVSKLEKKLKDSQAELRDVREELQASRSNFREDRPEDEKTSNQELTEGSQNMDKSTATENGKPSRKTTSRKRATEQAMMGEKSTFSITPFLNRTKDHPSDAATEAASLGLTLDDVLAQVESSNPSPLQLANKSGIRLNAAEKSRLKALKVQSKSAKKGAAIDEIPMPKLAGLDLDMRKVKSEDIKEEETSNTLHAEETVPHKMIKIPETAAAHRGSEFEHKKRKRKLLNKVNNTIIEEDESGDVAQPMETQPGRARKLKSAMGNAFNSRSTESTFSPLKRHKRGVNASFLA